MRSRQIAGSTFTVCLLRFGLLLSIWATYYTQGSSFIHTPAPVVTVQTGDVAVFECQHSDREAVIGWRVNGMPVASAGSNSATGITTEKHPQSETDSNVHILKINTTVNPSKMFFVKCTAHLADSNLWETSNETQLIVQDNYQVENTTQSMSSSVRIQKRNDTLDVFLLLRLEPQQEPHQYKLILQPVDDQGDESLNCMGNPDTQSESSNLGHINDVTILKVDCPLPPNRVWNYTLVAILLESNYTIVTNQELSTHDIQDITITPVYISNNSNALNVSVEFVEGSTAKGLLVVANPLTDDADTYYAVAARQYASQPQVSVHKGLLGGGYSVSIYVIDKQGLPFNRSASKPQTVLFPNMDSGLEDHNNVTSPATSSCDDIKTDECTNLCVVVATSYPHQYFKPQIINVYLFRREPSGASICAKFNDSMTDYCQFAIFQYDNNKKLISGLPRLIKCTNVHTLQNILHTLFTLSSVPVGIVAMAIIIYYFGWKERSKKQKTERNDIESKGVNIAESDSTAPNSTGGYRINLRKRIVDLLSPNIKHYK